MFAIFNNGELVDFWQNNKNDRDFVELTMTYLVNKQGLNSENIHIYWYEGISKKPNRYGFDENFNLLIKGLVEQQIDEENTDLVEGTVQTIEKEIIL